jgi:NAD(P)-dependent dehydrogenase (short-subunit alcohol dehydrogenase family)
MERSDPVQGMVCLVTGASRTLGAAIACRLALGGAHVAVNYHRSLVAARSLCDELSSLGVRALPVQADVADPDQALALVETTWNVLGAVDLLVNNVGPYVDTPFRDLPLADFDAVMAGNVRATFVLAQAVGNRMAARGRGHIINIAATDIYHRSHSVYGLAKAGVIHLTEALALELAPSVRVNAIAPDLIADNEDMEADFVRRSVAATPLGRLVTRQEIAEMVHALCTPTFDMVTGQTIVMDGGRTIPRQAMGGDT